MNDNSVWIALLKPYFLYLLGLYFLGYGALYPSRTFTSWAKKRYSEIAMRRMIFAARIFFIIIIIAGITVMVPLVSDTASLLKKGISWNNVAHTAGEVKLSNRYPIVWLLHQSFCFDDGQTFYQLLFNTTLVREKESYEIYYLPRSLTVLNIKRLSHKE